MIVIASGMYQSMCVSGLIVLLQAISPIASTTLPYYYSIIGFAGWWNTFPHFGTLLRVS